MKTLIILLFPILVFAQNQKYRMVIHGGAGTITKANMSTEQEKAYTATLEKALKVGHEILKNGGTSLDAVENTIQVLEESPLFNAGKGAVFANNGKNELDASIMDGSNLKAGAITGVHTIKSPISTARKVMEKSNHVLLSGSGAEEFAEEMGEEIVDPSYFFTEKRFNSLKKSKKKAKTSSLIFTEGEKFGTVGCVALDSHGNLAAGTSTGGMTNKKWNRIGDSPIIGAGTYANNATCAVSATGHGEYFMRAVVAYDISALMDYKQLSLTEAANEVIQTKLTKLGGTGGVVAIDKDGNIAMPFNTEGMYRGYIFENGVPKVYIYKD